MVKILPNLRREVDIQIQDIRETPVSKTLKGFAMRDVAKRENQADMTTGLPESWIRAKTASRPLSVFRMHALPLKMVGTVFKDTALRQQCCWDHPDSIYNWTQLRPLCKLRDSDSWCGDLLTLQLPKISPVCKFPSLIKLPPTMIKWSASFASLSLPSLYGGQFANLQTL